MDEKKFLNEMHGEAFQYIAETGRDWIETAKQHKAWFANYPALPPVVIAEKDDQIHCSIISPECNKHEGLKSCQMICCTIVPDHLTVILDAHMYQGKNRSSPENLVAEVEEFAQKFPPGSMQKMFEEGRGREMGIVECLNCIRIDREKKLVALSVPYERVGDEIVWDDANMHFMREGKSEQSMTGFIPEVLRKLIELESIKHDAPLREAAETILGKDGMDERADFHIAKAGMSILAQNGFIVIINDNIYGPIESFAQPHINMMAMSEDLDTLFTQSKH